MSDINNSKVGDNIIHDNNGKYFDYVYDFHKNIHQHINERLMFILNRDNFNDFFDFCLDHMNKPIMNGQINIERNRQINAEFKLPKIETIQSDDEYII